MKKNILNDGFFLKRRKICRKNASLGIDILNKPYFYIFIFLLFIFFLYVFIKHDTRMQSGIFFN